MTARPGTLVAFALALALALAAGCKQAGTIDVTVDVPATCAPATHVQVYLIRGATCACTCGDCLQACHDDNCTVGCPPEGCPIEALADGLAVRPPAGGQYAAVYQLIDRGGALPAVVAVACGVLTVDDDGTDDVELVAAGACCAP